MLKFYFLFLVVFIFGATELTKAQQPVPVSEAREMSEGDEVTISGWLTVTDHFRGPIYLQDETAGIAAFSNSLMRQGDFDIEAEVGDSVVVHGEIGFFNGLMQVVEGDQGLDIEVYPEANREIEPEEISLSDFESGNYESQLVTVNNVTVDAQAFLQAGNLNIGSYNGNNYTLDDGRATSVLRIQPLATHLEGSPRPGSSADITGVASVFNDQPQLLPRTVDDLGVEPFSYEGDEYPTDQTLDVVTWNIEWFGRADRGPDDVELQVGNVIQIIEDIQADVFAVQEIYDNELFRSTISEVDGYSAFVAETSFGLDLGYVYNTETVDSIDSQILDSSHGMNSYDHAGRLPLEFTFETQLEGESREVTAINVHAKSAAGDDPDESYERRVNASDQIRDYIVANLSRANRKVIYLGDYNDQIVESTYNGERSPYSNFDNDSNFEVLTKSLEEDEFFSFGFPPNRSMIDHITINDELFDFLIEGSQRVVTPRVVVDYLNTTSDHYPVLTRFQAEDVLTSSAREEVSERPEKVQLEQNYPNPFNPVTQIQYEIPKSQNVSLRVYDTLGRHVETLVDEHQPAGQYEVSFDGSRLSSGTYLFRLQAGDVEITRQMLLIK